MATTSLLLRSSKGSALTWTELDDNLQYLHSLAKIESGAGWYKLSNGLIMQAASTSTTTGQGDTVYFPTAFPGGVAVVLAMETNAVGWETAAGLAPTIYGCSDTSRASFRIWCARTAPSGVVYYGAYTGFNYYALGW